MLVDLHVHTARTPGCSLAAEEAIARAHALGLDGICFTDLDTLDGVAELHALRATAPIAVLVGMEAATDHGRYLCFFPDPSKIRAEEILGVAAANERPAREVVDAVLSRGGAVVAARPYDRALEKPMGDFMLTLRNLSAVEALTGTLRINANELAIEAAEHLALPCVGGSGAVAAEEIGTAATLFKEMIRDEAGLVDALKQGAVWAVAAGTPPRFHGDEAPRRESSRGEEREGKPRRDGRRDRRGGRWRQGRDRGGKR